MYVDIFQSGETPHLPLWQACIIENDHKPLEMIQHKPINVAHPRLQWMLLHMQKYDYNICYKPGKDMVLADHLICFPSWSNNLPIPIAHNVQHVQFSEAELDIIQGSMEGDPVYNTIYCLTLRGWPEHLQVVPHITQHLLGTRDELSVKCGLLLKGTRVCVSPELLNHTLADLHGAHQDINRMQVQVRGLCLGQA